MSTLRKLVLALAVLALGATMLHAQTAPAPAPQSSPPHPAEQAANAPDPDKKLVQDRWGTATGDSSKKLTKKEKPAKAAPGASSGNPQ
jgi:hypothetical protein